MKRTVTRLAVLIALGYILIAEAWDIFTDWFFTNLAIEPWRMAQYLILKDLIFCLLTGLLLFFILYREFGSLKKTEDALRASEERYRSLYQNSLDGILLTAPDGRILAANPAACQILGRSEAEICQLGRSGIVDLTDPRALEAIRERSKTGSYQSEMNLIYRDGTRFPAEISSAIFLDKDGNPRTSMIVRINRRKQAEAALRETENRLRLMLEKMPAILWATDTHLAYTYSVGAGLARIGVKPNEMLGRQIGASAFEENSATLSTSAFVADQHRKVMSEGIPTSFDTEWNGRFFHNELEPLYDSQNNITGCIGVGLDITDRVLAYQQLEQRVEERTHEIEQRRQVAEGLREIVATLNSNQPLASILDFIVVQANRILRVNSAALYLIQEKENTLTVQASTGQEDEVQKKWLVQTDADDLVNQAIHRLEPVVRTGWHAVDSATPAPEIHGGELVVPLIVLGEACGVIRLTYPADRILTGEEIALATAMADQAALAIENAGLHSQAEQLAVLNERNRLARELHDSVTQSIYSLTLMAEAGRRMLEAGDYEPARHSLHRLGVTAQQALKEIRLLVYELRPHILEREGLVGAIQQRLDAVEGRAGIETQLRVEQPVALTPTMEESLYRITQEALNNALKHAQASQVKVEIRAQSDTIELEVSDNGQGFDLNNLPDSGGMGLNNMRERAERLGGELSIQTAPGQGTTVRVSAKLT